MSIDTNGPNTWDKHDPARKEQQEHHDDFTVKERKDSEDSNDQIQYATSAKLIIMILTINLSTFITALDLVRKK